MNLLLASSVGVPLLALLLFTLLEAAGGTKDIWEILSRVGLDLCIVSIGIVGGMFLHKPLLTRMGEAAAVVALVVNLAEMVLAAVVMVVDKRSSWSLENKAWVSLFVGLFAVAIPSGIILVMGGS